MANQPDPNKKLVGVRVSLETYHKLLRLAGGEPSKVAEVIRKILAAQVEDIELTIHEHKAIIAELEANRKKQGRGKA